MTASTISLKECFETIQDENILQLSFRNVMAYNSKHNIIKIQNHMTDVYYVEYDLLSEP
jgi:hypothetical protein